MKKPAACVSLPRRSPHLLAEHFGTCERARSSSCAISDAHGCGTGSLRGGALKVEAELVEPPGAGRKRTRSGLLGLRQQVTRLEAHAGPARLTPGRWAPPACRHWEDDERGGQTAPEFIWTSPDRRQPLRGYPPEDFSEVVAFLSRSRPWVVGSRLAKAAEPDQAVISRQDAHGAGYSAAFDQ